MLSILAMILGVGLVICIHELCHMLVAKAFGVRVLKFAMGFGPVLLSHKIGLTSYELRVLPLGGFVQMDGECPSDTKEGGFFALSWYKRSLIALAGPVANLILGFILIFLALVFYREYPIIEGLSKSASLSSMVISKTVEGVGGMVVGTTSTKELSGPVMVTKILMDSFKVGFGDFLFVLSIISLSLGLFNLFPIPGLDGGHIFLYGIEGIWGKRLSEKVYIIWANLGILLLISLMVFTVWVDVVKLIK